MLELVQVSECVENIKFLSNVIDKSFGMQALLARAVGQLQEISGQDEYVFRESNAEITDPQAITAVLLPTVVGLRTGQPQMTMACLACLRCIIDAEAVPSTMGFTDIFNSSIFTEISGKPVPWVVLESLCDIVKNMATNIEVQIQALDCLCLMVADRRCDEVICGPILARCVQSCFDAHLASRDPAVKLKADVVLHSIVTERIVSVYVDHIHAATHTRPDTPLQTPIERVWTPNISAPRAPAGLVLPVLELTEISEAEESNPSEAEPMEYNLIKVPFSVLPPPERHSFGCKDLVFLLQTMIGLATTEIPSATTRVDSNEYKIRAYALSIIECVFESLPGSATHQHLSILGDIVEIVRPDIWRCIGANLAVVAPIELFHSALQILLHICVKCHYRTHPWLRWFFELVCAPLVKSKLTPFEHKIALIDFFCRILRNPDLIIAYYVNYECLDSTFSMGTLEFLVTVVTEVMFIDYTTRASRGTCDDDLLGRACVYVSSSYFEAENAQVNDEETERVEIEEEMYAASFSPHQQRQLRLKCGEAIGFFVAALIKWTLSEPPAVSTGPDCFFGHVHWRLLHQLHYNRRVIDAARSRFDVNWRHCRLFLIENKILDESAEAFARFIRFTPRFSKWQICSIMEKVLKDSFCRDITRAYFATFQYHDVPVDVALRDTTLEFMSWADRPQFETQVWAALQEDFGAEYSKQNPSMDPHDADALAGVVLFLHTNLHNIKVADKMSLDAFVRYGGDCLKVPLPSEEMTGIYNRVAGQKWVPKLAVHRLEVALEKNLSAYNRCPTLAALTKYHNLNLKKFSLDTLRSTQQALEAAEILSAPYGAAGSMWGGSMAQYMDNFSSLNPSQQSQLLYIQLATEMMQKFQSTIENVHPCDNLMRIPFCVPIYAQHAKAILKQTYPFISSAISLLLRNGSSVSELCLGVEMQRRMNELAEIFSLMLCDLQQEADKIFHRLLRIPHAVSIGEVTHATLSCLIPNKI